MKTQRFTAALFLSALALPVFGAEIIVTSRHEVASTRELKRDYSRIGINDVPTGTSASDSRITKTIQVAKLAGNIESALESMEKICALKKDERTAAREAISAGLLRNDSVTKASEDSQVGEAIKLVTKLGKNILADKSFCPDDYVYVGCEPAPQQCQQQQCQQQQCQQQQQQQQQQQMQVGAGGAQDAGLFRAQVEDGYVPTSSDFSIEGFMSEFNLSLTERSCESILCIQPAYFIDRDAKKLFVQVGMSTMITEKSFRRSPLNLSIVIDISGSMGATDGTEKTRIEWAKDAAKETVRRLNEMDTLSIVLFNDQESTLLEPTSVSNKDLIFKKIESIQAGGSTNLESGLRKSYEFVSEQITAGRENRVILISDAGLNTGIISQEDLVRMVGDFSAENIGLTALGMGENFNQKFIHGITLSKGGNYLYVQSGRELKNYFDQFDFLTTPVAYNFKASLEITGLQTELVKTYGIPMKESSPVQDLVDIRTLFLTSSKRGGATLLEYDLK